MKSEQTVLLVIVLVFAAIVILAIMQKKDREVVQMPVSEASSGGMDIGALIGMMKNFM
jgi:quinol-cytochrome oxidoreductase complex cytochrome b subunit